MKRFIVSASALIVGSLLLLILVFDPPPLRLRDANEFALSVTAPNKLDPQFTHPIEGGLACTRKLHSWTDNLGRPEITVFDWLRRQSGKASEDDYHLQGEKTDDAWSIKIDRSTNKFCWLTAREVSQGDTTLNCGPIIVREDDDYIQAFDNGFGTMTVVFFDKKTYQAVLISVGAMGWLGTAMNYLECR